MKIEIEVSDELFESIRNMAIDGARTGAVKILSSNCCEAEPGSEASVAVCNDGWDDLVELTPATLASRYLYEYMTLMENLSDTGHCGYYDEFGEFTPETDNDDEEE